MNTHRGILIICELAGNSVHRVSFELLNKAMELKERLHEPVDCLLLGPSGKDLNELNLRGADTVYYMQSPVFKNPEEYLFKENITRFIKQHKPGIVLTGATSFGRSLAPRIAAALRTGLTADCTDLKIDEDGNFIQIRPAFSDNILAHINTVTYPKMATVRYKEFEEAQIDSSKKINIVEIEPYVSFFEKSQVIDIFSEESIDISEAEIIVAAGRGIRKKEDLKMIEELAAKLGGTVGASRALVDAGMVKSTRQVGYSGNRVKPKVYVACGISGAPQHLAGMKESEIIVAINSDPSAPIFSVADYGYVGDIYEIVPALIRDLP
ncbi:MAG: electron transfer flavoprotein subunit alpha/FixB family protein [Sedimentibacter sp.]|uniref:electron transfer flavoprotein subunit alpha/FixB family protein n=1 Tax=Sedimentibacter sp. TaxID=1960295 RepID=UPI003158445D